MNARAFSRALAAAALLALCSCVTVPEFQALRRKVDQLEKGKSGGGDEWDGKSGSGGAPAAPSRLADLDAEVASLHDEVGRLQGEVDSLKKEVARLRGGGAAGNPSPGPDAATGAAAGAGGAAAAGAEAGAAGAAPGAAPGTNGAVSAPNPGSETAGAEGASASPEEVRDYETAFSLYRGGKYADAIDRFQAFLQTHPSSEFADNALFWMGESYFKLNDFEQAAVAFDRVVKRFPNGNKVPDALYRQGVSLQEIGTRTGQKSTYGPAACQIFKRIADEYPNSERVAEARRQLEKCPS